MHRTLAHTDGGCFFVMHRTLAHTNGWWFFVMHRAVGAYQWRMVFCDAPRRWRMPMENGFLRCTARWRMPMDGGFLRCTASLAHTKGECFFQWGMSMVGRRFLCRIILVGIVLKLWLSVIFSMIYLSIKCFYEKMSEKLVFCC